MVVPTFVDLQGFIVGRAFIVKEVAILRKGTVLSHYVFGPPFPRNLLTRFEKSQVSWLTVKHHGLLWTDGYIPYGEAKRLIKAALLNAIEEEEDGKEKSLLVYVKGLEKRRWLQDILSDDIRRHLIIETLDAEYKEIASLKEIDSSNTYQCEKHRKHCALQNVFKIFNWWSKRQRI